MSVLEAKRLILAPDYHTPAEAYEPFLAEADSQAAPWDMLALPSNRGTIPHPDAWPQLNRAMAADIQQAADAGERQTLVVHGLGATLARDLFDSPVTAWVWVAPSMATAEGKAQYGQLEERDQGYYLLSRQRDWPELFDAAATVSHAAMLEAASRKRGRVIVGDDDPDVFRRWARILAQTTGADYVSLPHSNNVMQDYGKTIADIALKGASAVQMIEDARRVADNKLFEKTPEGQRSGRRPRRRT